MCICASIVFSSIQLYRVIGAHVYDIHIHFISFIIILNETHNSKTIIFIRPENANIDQFVRIPHRINDKE